MRTFRLLATSLLVALSMGVSSCSEELDSQPMESYPEGGEPLDVVCEEYGISDYEDIELLSYYKNNLEQANFSGLREEKLWLASFNVKISRLLLIGLTNYHLIGIVRFTKAMENMKMSPFSR